MQQYLAIILMLGVSAEANAQSRRPDTLRMTCQQAAALVQSHGTIVLGTGPNLYDRYVTSCRFCYDSEYLLPSWVQTADNAQCFVGYHCDTQSQLAEPSCGLTGFRGPPNR
jgi:hypothetical protein